VVAFADGIKGIERFVVDSFVEATRSGGICPPSLIGVGIGGTANIAANLAKEAACLRTIGSWHPEEAVQKIETDLYHALNHLGVGIMGIGGSTSYLPSMSNMHIRILRVSAWRSAVTAWCPQKQQPYRRGRHGADHAGPDWFNGR
jgi:tartrate dehydratase alpha subunit/fumarate hydratase class I-like protein